MLRKQCFLHYVARLVGHTVYWKVSDISSLVNSDLITGVILVNLPSEMFPLNSLWTRLPAVPLIKLSRTAPTMMRRLRTVGKARELESTAIIMTVLGLTPAGLTAPVLGEKNSQGPGNVMTLKALSVQGLM